MHREHMEAIAKMYKITQRLKELGRFGAYATTLFGHDRRAVGVSIEKAFDAYTAQHPGDDREYVMAALRRAQGSRPMVLVFADSALGQMA